MTASLSRDEQTAIALALVRGLLGDRDATRVEVAVTQGGTYRIVAETGEAAVKRQHEWKP